MAEMTCKEPADFMYSDGVRVCRAVGERTPGGAYAHYEIFDPYMGMLVDIPFQHGLVSDVGVVGATNVCLLAIVRDRLQMFQKGKDPCCENSVALYAIDAALMSLENRALRYKLLDRLNLLPMGQQFVDHLI